MVEFPSLGLVAPAGCIIGIIQEGEPVELSAPGVPRLSSAVAMPEQATTLILDHAFSALDAVAKALAVSHMVQQSRAGATFVLITHDEPLLESCADEIWWLRGEKLIARGVPVEVLERYRVHVAQALREAGRDHHAPIVPVLRAGDGRAALESIELLGSDSLTTTVWKSGEAVTIRVTVRFLGKVADPVIGILIRTRIGLNVYGTNTGLENIHFGPMQEGDTVRLTCRFGCELCPGDYTLTVASHDPDGVWHDWLEDAVAFSVSDDRYTAGVANLRARVGVEVLPRG
jgi:lipopolysaccharide transport system ATP-binding protein